MSREDPKLYEASSTQNAIDPYAFEHCWDGRRISITGGLRPKSLWMIAGYMISIDGIEKFETASLAMTEDFTWTFRHNGRDVEGNFRTKGFNNGIVRRFDLLLDNEYIGNFKIRLAYWWAPYAMFLVSVMTAACVFLAAHALS
jgi:hypothetical protein